MMDETWREVATRDRRRLALARRGGYANMPTRLEVGYVARVENAPLWKSYCKLRSNFFELHKTGNREMQIRPHYPVPISTRLWLDRDLGLPHPELFSSLNEFYVGAPSRTVFQPEQVLCRGFS